MAKQVSFSVSTNSRMDFVKIDHQIQKIVSESGINDGICCIYIPHTTAAVTINEGADPSVVRDIEMELNKVVPFQDNYSHLEGNSAAHIKSSIVGASEAVIIEGGQLKLGTWQSIFFCEFDGPRRRTVWVKIV
jgi:secondary thiamine-phosphate synthase enzyme